MIRGDFKIQINVLLQFQDLFLFLRANTLFKKSSFLIPRSTQTFAFFLICQPFLCCRFVSWLFYFEAIDD